MSLPFVGEIRIFAGDYAPVGWAFCDGQSLQVAEFTELYSLIGTTYGGDGRIEFAVPNLAMTAPLHEGKGQGLTLYQLGQRVGSETVTLTTDQIPPHTHVLQAVNNAPTSSTPAGNYVASGTGRQDFRYQTSAANLGPWIVSSAQGGGLGHNNLQPFLAMRFIIALQGQYPAQS